MGFVVGLAIAVAAIPLWVRSYRRFLPGRAVKQETVGPDGKSVTRTYESISSIHAKTLGTRAQTHLQVAFSDPLRRYLLHA